MEKMVLVVIPDRGICGMVKMYLSSARYSVWGAQSQADAMGLETLGIVVVVIDGGMADWQVIARYYMDRFNVPSILLLDEGGDVPSQNELMDMGVFDCVVKPVETNKLLKAVGGVLAKSSAAGRQAQAPRSRSA